MLEKLLEGAAGAIRAAGTSTAANAENALYLVKLVYDFLFGVAGSDPTSWSVKVISNDHHDEEEIVLQPF